MSGMQKEKVFHQSIGRVLHQYRLDRKLSSQNVAQRISVSYQQIQKSEHGINRLTVLRLLEYGKVYRISPHALLADIIKEIEKSEISGTMTLG